MIRSVLSFATLAALAGSAPALLGAQQVEHRRAVSADASIKIFLMSGTVRVIGWDRDSLVVRGTIRGGAHRFHIGGSDAAVKMFVDERGKESPDGELEVRVPSGAKVWVKTESATIDVRDVAGSVDLNTVTGSVRVSGTLRDIYAEAMDAAIELAVTAPSIRAKTAGGAIRLEGGGDNIRLTTVSGTIAATIAAVERARFESVTGNITFVGDVARGASCALESHSGRIELAMPRSTSADFDIGTFGGTIENRLTSRQATSDDARRSRRLAFTAGDGGAEIQVRTFKGPVILRPR